MSLDIEDIYNNLESFRNKHSFSQDKMAKIVGMSGKSAYSKMIKTRSMKLEYLINLLNNSEISVEQIFRGKGYSSPEVNKSTTNEIQISTYSCADCIIKQKEIEFLNTIIETKDKYIKALEELNEKNESRHCG